MSFDAGASRIGMMIRLVGLVFLAIGLTLIVVTYQSAGNSSIVPQIVPVFYLGSGLLVVVGFVAIIAKYK